MCDFLQEMKLKTLYKAFLKPFNEYGVLAWGGAPKTHLIKIERNLNKAVRIMLFKGKFESAHPLFQYLNFVPLHLSVNLQQSKFMKKLILCQHSDFIQEYQSITYLTSINKKNNTKLILPITGLQREIHHFFIMALEHGTMFQKFFKSFTH